MLWILLLIVIGAVLILFVKQLGNKKPINQRNKKSPSKYDVLPYRRKESLLNGYEQELYKRLREAIPDFVVMCQVRLADIIEVTESTPGNERMGWQNKINPMSVDFVICDQAFLILAVIELDGKTHERRDRKEADASKDDMLKAAGIDILRFKAVKMPSVEELKKILIE